MRETTVRLNHCSYKRRQVSRSLTVELVKLTELPRLWLDGNLNYSLCLPKGLSLHLNWFKKFAYLGTLWHREGRSSQTFRHSVSSGRLFHSHTACTPTSWIFVKQPTTKLTIRPSTSRFASKIKEPPKWWIYTREGVLWINYYANYFDNSSETSRRHFSIYHHWISLSD